MNIRRTVRVIVIGILFFCIVLVGFKTAIFSHTLCGNEDISGLLLGDSCVNCISRCSGYALSNGSNKVLLADFTLPSALSKAWIKTNRSHPLGVGVADNGRYAGKLVSYNDSGAETPIRVFGVNYYDAFLRYLKNDKDTSFVEGFKFLQTHNIPVARVLAGGFWPNDWNLYFSDKEEYYRRLDFFISKAEQYNIGLILDFFWSVATVGELVDNAVAAGYLTPGRDFAPPNPLNLDSNGTVTYAEYKRALGRPTSGSNAWIAYYTQEVVKRYVGSSVVWGWEFGNEYNLRTDHPNIRAMRKRKASSGMTLPNTSSDLKKLPAWTGPDDLVREDVRVAKMNFATVVRRNDTWRMILSGDSKPRKTAYHNWKFHSWVPDSRSELAQVLAIDNPKPIDTVTIHLYPGKPDEAPTVYFTDSPVTMGWLKGQYTKLLGYFLEKSEALGQPLIVGEWGVIGDGTSEDEKKSTTK